MAPPVSSIILSRGDNGADDRRFVSGYGLDRFDAEDIVQRSISRDLVPGAVVVANVRAVGLPLRVPEGTEIEISDDVIGLHRPFAQDMRSSAVRRPRRQIHVCASREDYDDAVAEGLIPGDLPVFSQPTEMRRAVDAGQDGKGFVVIAETPECGLLCGDGWGSQKLETVIHGDLIPAIEGWVERREWPLDEVADPQP